MVTRCGRCGSPNSVSITIELPGGTRVEMISCHACDSRTWQGPEGEVTLEQVLAMASEKRDD